MANGLFVGGDGTDLNPYLIEDAHDLAKITGGTIEDIKHYRIMSDIDMNGYEDMFPIMNPNGRYICLDGNNRNIINSRKTLIMFPQGSTFKNIRILDCDIQGEAALAGDSNNNNNVTFRNCYISGKLTGTSYVGGITSRPGDNCLIENCIVELDIEASDYVGGLYGSFKGRSEIVIKNSIARGKITQTPFSTNGRIGGIGGGGKAQIVNSYSSMEIVASTNFRVNGLVGFETPMVINSYWNKDVVTVQGGISEEHGLTTQQIKTAQTFIDVGWDLELNEDGSPVWILKDGEYPKLWFEIKPLTKFLIKQGTNYHTIKPEFYENGKYSSVILDGGSTPNINDFENYGFDSEGDLVISNGKFVLGMEEGSIVGEGRIYKKAISGYGNILKIRGL